MIKSDQTIGKSINRVDGIKKVTGQASYAADFDVPDVAYGYVVNSSIAKGKITSINTAEVKAIPGVLEVFTHENLPPYLNANADYTDPLSPPGHPFRPLYDENILFSHQPIALIVANTFELARYAAGILEVIYEEDKNFTTELSKNLDKATTEDVEDPAEPRGNAAEAYEKAKVKLEVEYEQPRLYHNPMEPHASIVSWDDDSGFMVYDKIQGVYSSKKYISGIFGVDKHKVRVLAPFIGGGFGSGLRPQYQLFFAALAARELKLPVKVVMTRQQMFSFGHRPACIQKLKLSANADGKLQSIEHAAFSETSQFEKFSETITDWSGLMYQCDNVKFDYKLVPLDNYTPLDTRGPGGTTGMFALETAIDELAVKMGIDPLQFRLINYAETDQNEGKPFSSKELKACFQQASEAFGWDKRKAEPGTHVVGDQLIGYGVAVGCWEAMQKKAAARAILTTEGHLTVSSATADIGTGTYTVMSQIAADTLGMPIDRVDFKLGDSNLPNSPIEGGSWTVSSVGSAVKMVCHQLKSSLFALAKEHFEISDRYILEEARFKDGHLSVGEHYWSYQEILKKAGKGSLEVNVKSEPDEDRDEYSYYAHSCVMVEVNIDKDLGMITIPRIVSAVAGGNIINPKTAESQILGGIAWGVGMALEEEGMMDHQFGRIMNSNLAEYHLPVHADIRDVEVIFVPESDKHVNPLGAKGLGEVGLVGVAAAIGNAIYNATGKRLRRLPFQLDKVLEE